MSGSAVRGALAAWLGLIALQAVGTAGGSGRIAELFTAVNDLVTRALDPSVPAIPDRRAGAAAPPVFESTQQPSGGYRAWGPYAPDGTGLQPTTPQRLPGLPLNTNPQTPIGVR